MATTNFITGTTIKSDWLNDVDAAVYETLPSLASASSLSDHLADTVGAHDASAISYTPPGIGAVPTTVETVLEQGFYVTNYGATGDGATDDYAAIVAADVYAASIGAVVVFPAGTFVCNTSYTFTASVVMRGGVISGTGTVSFPKGFSAPLYYCFDCLVGQIVAPAVHAEWFGARRATTTPTGSGATISAKPWNAWPSFINNANYLTKQNYGNGTFLAANKPFANTDSWDFIGIQRALWSIGVVTSGTGRGKVALLAGDYYLTRAVRFCGDMSSTLSGAGRTKTIIHHAAHDTHELQTLAVGSARVLLSFYKTGPDPIYVSDLCILGPSGYGFWAAPYEFNVAMTNSNGITFDNCWISVADADIYLEDSCSDIWVRGCMFEYGTRMIWGYDSGSWLQIADCGFWKSPGLTMVGVQVAGYAFITGSTFVSLNNPFILGLGSHMSGCTVIEDGTGYRSTVNGRVVTRRMQINAGTTRSVLVLKMDNNTALRTRMVVGGTVAGVGAAGIERTLVWYREATNPVADTPVATKWGTVGAIALISETTSTDTVSCALQITNTGTGSQHFLADVTVFVEGSDFVMEGL